MTQQSHYWHLSWKCMFIQDLCMNVHSSFTCTHQSKCPLNGQWLIHTVEYFSTIKRMNYCMEHLGWISKILYWIGKKKLTLKSYMLYDYIYLPKNKIIVIGSDQCLVRGNMREFLYSDWAITQMKAFSKISWYTQKNTYKTCKFQIRSVPDLIVLYKCQFIIFIMFCGYVSYLLFFKEQSVCMKPHTDAHTRARAHKCMRF